VRYATKPRHHMAHGTHGEYSPHALPIAPKQMFAVPPYIERLGIDTYKAGLLTSFHAQTPSRLLIHNYEFIIHNCSPMKQWLVV